ncbi:MAG: tyrosine-type recombinase/integrase [Chloroflexi bacterium]|uniref:Tyrosine-type recombinase/integrase n=1 Tax=Candidatus Chlorohelix allophototropha TaxID=3003348 RepID=A0A8T7M1S4_9CHLR|nr:tyrosine-type recombinase/integrase [Chloroflexota bacterium]WJW67569.1 tyrosine-type recombinase/integrase [Chloroflexota bacterium L227-S17]
MADEQVIPVAQSVEIVSVNQEETNSLPLDQNPAAVYLATLRPVGRRGMLRALTLIAEVVSGGKQTALTLPWHKLRYQHTAAIAPVLVERGYRPATVNQALSGLRSVLYHAWKLGLMESEDYQRARDVKNRRGETLPRGRALDKDELKALIKTCQAEKTPGGLRDAALIGLMYGTGLRRSEVVKLELKDYNPATGALTIRGAKGGKDRLVYVKGGAAKSLAVWLEQRGDTAGALFCPVHKSGKVRVEIMTDQSVMKILKKRGLQTDLESFSPHDLRRTFISDLLDAGADIATVQKLAGHASVTTTARYDRRGEAAKSKATDLLEIPY